MLQSGSSPWPRGSSTAGEQSLIFTGGGRSQLQAPEGLSRLCTPYLQCAGPEIQNPRQVTAGYAGETVAAARTDPDVPIQALRHRGWSWGRSIPCGHQFWAVGPDVHSRTSPIAPERRTSTPARRVPRTSCPWVPIWVTALVSRDFRIRRTFPHGMRQRLFAVHVLPNFIAAIETMAGCGPARDEDGVDVPFLLQQLAPVGISPASGYFWNDGAARRSSQSHSAMMLTPGAQVGKMSAPRPPPQPRPPGAAVALLGTARRCGQRVGSAASQSGGRGQRSSHELTAAQDDVLLMRVSFAAGYAIGRMQSSCTN